MTDKVIELDKHYENLVKTIADQSQYDHACIRVSKGLKAIAHIIDSSLQALADERIAFNLIVFTEPAASHVANFERAQLIEALEQFLEHLKGDAVEIPIHEQINDAKADKLN